MTIGRVAILMLAFGIVAAGVWRVLPCNRTSQPVIAGAVDVGFAQAMRSHHEQAIVMAEILMDRGSSRLAALARSIHTAQLIEIGEMKGWLLLWNKPLLPTSSAMNWMLLGKSPPDATLSRYLADCRSSAGGMPGLASSDDLNQLRSLDGEARDRLFLQLMTRHHEGALPMARFARVNAESSAVRTLAAQMEMEQSQEIVTMALLATRQ